MERPEEETSIAGTYRPLRAEITRLVVDSSGSVLRRIRDPRIRVAGIVVFFPDNYLEEFL